jgi:hypothetical protein
MVSRTDLAGQRVGELQVPRVTSQQVWRAVAKASFAVVGYVTPSGSATFQRGRVPGRRSAAVRGGGT